MKYSQLQKSIYSLNNTDKKNRMELRTSPVKLADAAYLLYLVNASQGANAPLPSLVSEQAKHPLFTPSRDDSPLSKLAHAASTSSPPKVFSATAAPNQNQQNFGHGEKPTSPQTLQLGQHGRYERSCKRCGGKYGRHV